jgi:RimJ/RimL family protein N-acetyltransferase
MPASICYSAAEADHRVEIDVLTLPEYRNRGLARHAVMTFVERCFSFSLHPLWDCFTNNAGSMRLCQAVGFTAVKAPYPFFTINRVS